MVSAQEDAQLETLLTQSFPHARFRNLAWEGDTVYEQRREMNFGAWEQQLKRAGATVVFAQFGQVEAFQGRSSLPKFVEAYDKLVDEFSRHTKRIVLLSPIPFEAPPPPLPDLSSRNDELRGFAQAVRDIAAKRGFLYVDLFDPFVGQGRGGLQLTDDGMHLSAKGHGLVAREIQRQLGFGQRLAATRSAEHLRELIQEKNRLWFDYWRPMNWAFLNGDRTEQPSSRDHRNPAVRWFPDEMAKFLPLIESKEKEIAAVAAGGSASAAPAAPSPDSAATTGLAKEDPDDPAVELASFHVAAGFHVNLFASEKDGLVKPIQMRFDARGRLWVVGSTVYPQIEPGQRPNDKVLILEDSSGEGRCTGRLYLPTD